MYQQALGGSLHNDPPPLLSSCVCAASHHCTASMHVTPDIECLTARRSHHRLLEEEHMPPESCRGQVKPGETLGAGSSPGTDKEPSMPSKPLSSRLGFRRCPGVCPDSTSQDPWVRRVIPPLDAPPRSVHDPCCSCCSASSCRASVTVCSGSCAAGTAWVALGSCRAFRSVGASWHMSS